ncbi:MAG: hypothetical protein LUC50_04545 [Ruminococcus sp.]|nr:hypothetical protein [Ruminococcus sp.]
MTQKKRTAKTHFLVTEPYLITRGAALHFPSKQFQSMLASDDSVYGFVVDIPANPQTLITMVVYINGASNLYFNNGNSYTGAAQRYPAVVQAGRLLAANCSRILAETKKTTVLDLPTGQEHHIFLLTKGGIYKKVFLPSDIPDASRDLQTVYVLYQKLMQELHTAQLKDRTAGILQN